jgi:hypothetical protein
MSCAPVCAPAAIKGLAGATRRKEFVFATSSLLGLTAGRARRDTRWITKAFVIRSPSVKTLGVKKTAKAMALASRWAGSPSANATQASQTTGQCSAVDALTRYSCTRLSAIGVELTS